MQHNVSLPAWSDAPELVKDGVLHVSIHVPAWGATTEFLAMRLPTMFQSTFPRGERHTANHGCLFWEMFQSTLPRGERPKEPEDVERAFRFQSTLPRGERQGAGVREQRGDHVSIHAPAWGATMLSRMSRMMMYVSIHAPAWGATTPAPSSEPPKAVSIHAPAWGATRILMRLPRRLMFQSTLPRGERLNLSITNGGHVWFQSTLPRGERPSNK